ncbi:MAG TPA: glycosyltransferase family 4 protein [Ferruginibacter sp.]|nr:glycosyltransferase family 4 protein [Ferruginibacter sp.]HMP21254.1 glycosyltransferase family 4 protein [Ferruginibacter sp.]
MKKKLAIITSHPIQYHAPLFELLATRGEIDIHVFYTWGTTVLDNKYDPGFGRVVHWDIPLLNGYPYTFLENTAADKGTHHFNGIVNPGIIAAINHYAPDAILVFGWAFNSHLKVMRYFKNKIPVLFRGDSTLLDKTGFIKSLQRKIVLRWVYRHVDIGLYVGKSNYDYFRKFGLSNGQLIFAPHAIDNNRFKDKQAVAETAMTIRKQLGIPGEAPVFLFTGKMEPKKDPGCLLDAFSRSTAADTAHVILCGSGELEAALKEKYTASTRIHFVGFQNQLQIPAYYHAADIFVLPSRGPEETWGLSVNEAMAAGKAVIVSDKCGCAANLVQQGENGFVFKAGDTGALSTMMNDLSNNAELVKQMGNKSFEMIQSYSIDKLAAVVEHVVSGKAAFNKN